MLHYQPNARSPMLNSFLPYARGTSHAVIQSELWGLFSIQSMTKRSCISPHKWLLCLSFPSCFCHPSPPLMSSCLDSWKTFPVVLLGCRLFPRLPILHRRAPLLPCCSCQHGSRIFHGFLLSMKSEKSNTFQDEVKMRNDLAHHITFVEEKEVQEVEVTQI